MVYLNVSICAEHDRIHLPLEMKCYFRPRRYLTNTSKLSPRSPALVSRRGGGARGAEGSAERSGGTCERQRSAARSAPGAGHRAPPAAGDRAPACQPRPQAGTSREHGWAPRDLPGAPEATGAARPHRGTAAGIPRGAAAGPSRRTG